MVLEEPMARKCVPNADAAGLLQAMAFLARGCSGRNHNLTLVKVDRPLVK